MSSLPLTLYVTGYRLDLNASVRNRCIVAQDSANLAPKWQQNEAKMEPTWHQNGAKWSQNESTFREKKRFKKATQQKKR